MEASNLHKVYTEVSKALSEINTKRKRSLFFQKIMWCLTGVYLVFMIVFLFSNNIPTSEGSFFSFLRLFKASTTNPYANLYPVLGLMVLLYPSTILFARAFQKFKTQEAQTMAKMVRQLFPMVEFTQGAVAPKNEIVQSKLFAWIKKDSPIYSFGQIRSHSNQLQINIADIGFAEENLSNKITGILANIPLLNSLVVMYQYVFKNIVENKSTDNLNFTFRGMFCWLKFNKKLNGHTVVLTNNQHEKLNRFFSSHFKQEQRIHLEDPRFTDAFIVYSTDQVEARYVLSTAIMERIVALKAVFNQPILVSFQHHQLYLAVQNEHGLFSFPSGNLNKIKVVKALAADIETALHISEHLNLKSNETH